MELNEALSLLTGGAEGISEWNQRRSKGEAIPSLEKVDLTGANLAGVKLDSRETEIVNLKGAILVS